MKKPATISSAAIRKCFTDAIKGHRLPIPDDEACQWAARLISKDVASIGQRLRPPTLGVAEKHARLFLRHATTAQATVEARFQAAAPNVSEPKDNPHFEALLDFKMAQNALSSLLKRYGDEKVRVVTWHDIANRIANYATRAWDMPVGKAMDVNPGSALCSFVRLALSAAGINHSKSTISDALRFRSGQIGREVTRERAGRKKAGENRSK